MKFRLFLVLLVSLATKFTFAGHESMPSMPKLEPKKIYTVTGNEDFESQQGFGEDESKLRMMNLMMVEGSGYEGMDMDSTKIAQNNPHSGHSMPESVSGFQIDLISNAPAKVGTNNLEFSVKKDGKDIKGLKIKSQVYMTSMDMGTEQPRVKETGPGKYSVKTSFSMKGPWAVKLIFADSTEKIFNFEVNPK